MDAAHAWPNLLARSLRCRVDNFGIGGYGTDQAYLRYRQNVAAGKDSAPIVIITVFTEDVRRNVNQLRGLIFPTDHSQFGLKPRFIIGRNGNLKLIPMPSFNHKQFDRALEDPSGSFMHEYFVPGSKDGLVLLQFPYSQTIALVFYRLLRIADAKIRGLPFYYDFYRRGHPAHALDITIEIITQFRDDVARRGGRLFALVIPSSYELSYFHRRHIWVDQPLLDALTERHIAVIDFGSEALGRIPNYDPCSLYVSCRRHLNEHGYDLVAQMVNERLAETMSLKSGLSAVPNLRIGTGIPPRRAEPSTGSQGSIREAGRDDARRR